MKRVYVVKFVREHSNLSLSSAKYLTDVMARYYGYEPGARWRPEHAGETLAIALAVWDYVYQRLHWYGFPGDPVVNDYVSEHLSEILRFTNLEQAIRVGEHQFEARDPLVPIGLRTSMYNPMLIARVVFALLDWLHI